MLAVVPTTVVVPKTLKQSLQNTEAATQLLQ
jgi:hypothetical protein